MLAQCLSRGVRIPLLLLLIVPAIFMFLLYKSNVHQLQQSDQVKTMHLVQLPTVIAHDSSYKQPVSSKYNLMEDFYGSNWAKTPADKYLSPSDCTVEYANDKKLQQDHPCVIQLIRDKYLRQPANKNLPYQLDHPEKVDSSDGQAKDIRNILKNKTKGFFVESGGFDGEYLSNTLFMERYLDWSGLLIEADKKSYSKLFSRNRKAFTLPNCISTKPYPIQVLFNGPNNAGGSILETAEANISRKSNEDKESVYAVQCFPFYSILLAVDRIDVDYFGLDVEGAEYKILETIPWHKVNIKTMTVEWNHIQEGEPALTRLMESNHFKKSHMISLNYSKEVVYVHESLNATNPSNK